MPVNVSEIAVRVTGDTVQLQLQMQKAAQSIQQVTRGSQQTVNGVNRSMKAAQGIAQNAVFAVDDFVAAFQTGGFAGGLRGAANNLTYIASQIGTIKTQLLAIAGIASVQLGMTIFNQWRQAGIDVILDDLKLMKERIEELNKGGVENLRFDRMVTDIVANGDLERLDGELSKIGEQLEELEGKSKNFQRAIKGEASTLAGLQAQRAEIEKFIALLTTDDSTIFSLVFQNDTARENMELLSRIISKTLTPGIDEAADGMKEFQKEAGKAASNMQKLQLQQQKLQEQRQMVEDRSLEEWRKKVHDEEVDSAQMGLEQLDKRLNDILDPQGKAARVVADQIREVNRSFKVGLIDEDEALRRIDMIREAAITELGGDGASLITGQLPSAARAGSSAAVSAINQRIGGTMNTFEQKTALNTQKSAEALKRIEAEIKKGQAVIVGVK